MKKQLWLTMTIALIMVLTACGPSTEKTATVAAPDATSTSAAPAQVLYGLNVMVNDQDGAPIPWATGNIQTSGKDVPGKTNDTGQLVWGNLSGAEGQLNVFAQGYTTVQQTLSLAQGSNDLSIVLELDPLQLNPATVCQPGEKLIYVEDFEDSLAQDFENIAAPKWSLVNLDDRGLVMEVNSPGGNTNTLIKSEFGNAVWQFDMMTSGVVDVDFNWHWVETTEGANTGISRYYVSYQPGALFKLGVDRPGASANLVEAESPVFEEGTWHTFAIAYYKGAISIWVDGLKAMDVEHDTPLEKGRFGIQINSATQGELWLDNLIVCGLQEPYMPPAATP